MLKAKVPYIERTSNRSDFEKLKAFLLAPRNSTELFRPINLFNRHISENQGTIAMNESRYTAMKLKNVLSNEIKDNMNNYMTLIHLPYEYKQTLEESYGIDTSNMNYLEEHNKYFNTDNFPMVNEINKKEKIKQFFGEVLNQLFYPFEKSYDEGYFKVTIPEDLINSYESFVNNRLYYRSIEEDNTLRMMLDNFVTKIAINKKHNLSVKNILEYTLLGEDVNFDSLTSELSIHIDADKALTQNNENEIPVYAYKLLYFSVKMINFFVIAELAREYEARRQAPNIEQEKEKFLNYIKDRRVLISEISHKGAKKSAEKLGLTHFFLPIDEENIPEDLPFSLKVDLREEDKIKTIWTILPPTERYYTIRRYKGHNNEYPNFTTLAEPHLMKGELVQTKFNDYFYYYLVDNYDWEYREELKLTLDLIEKHPRLLNDLNKLAKERE